MPELRILDDELWQAVKDRQKAVKLNRSDDGETKNHFQERRRPKYLFSGLTKCACYGGCYSMISADLVGCSTARNKGTCDNRRNIRRDQFEARRGRHSGGGGSGIFRGGDHGSLGLRSKAPNCGQI